MFARHPLERLPVNAADALRMAIIAELDAISFYEQVAREVEDDRVRKLFEDIAREEKTHFGEFLSLLKKIDPEQARELETGASEAEKLIEDANVSEKANNTANTKK